MQQLQPNTLLQGGRYRIVRDIGQGGFGITYLAEDTAEQRTVAIKEFFWKQYCERIDSTSYVRVPIADNTELVGKFMKKFENEAKTIRGLKHPNIIKVYDAFRENGTSYYVMEYIDGTSLDDVTAEKGWQEESVALRYIRKVGAALEYIHNQHVTHLDIKPQNIMLSKRGKITVIDFGVSKLYHDDGSGVTMTTPVGMSKGYSPFEQTYQGGMKSFSPQSDVYALAATLYKLLTGVTPPPSPKVKDDGLPLKPLNSKGVSSNVVNAIVNAMRLRNTRTQSVSEFLRQLDDESTEIIDEATIISGGVPNINSGGVPSIKKAQAISYPLTISVNKKIYTDCQLWTIMSIILHNDKTVVRMKVQSYDGKTWANSSGTGVIKTNTGKSLYSKSTSLPNGANQCIINPWKEEEITEIYPPIPSDVTKFDLIDNDNDTFSLKGITISNGTANVPDAYSEKYLGITKDEYYRRRNRIGSSSSSGYSSNDEDSGLSIKGIIYLIFIILFIVVIIKILIS